MLQLREMNTLRNQIFAVFALTMFLVLILIGFFVYSKVSILLKESAEKRIEQTAVQANGRLDALLEQIDSLTTQVATDAYVQNLLLRETRGQEANFNERQSLLQIANHYMAYTSGIQSFEIYTNDHKRLFPLDDSGLYSHLSDKAIAAADDKKGRIAWLGINTRLPDTVLAVRRINLLNLSYQPGGYLVVHVHRDYFNMNDPERTAASAKGRESMLLGDGDNNPIMSDISVREARLVLTGSGNSVEIEGRRLLAVRQNSDVTGWKLVLLVPVESLTEGISILRTAIYVTIGLAALAFLLLALLLSTMITRPILQLIRSMRGARFGGLKLIPKGRSRFWTKEINELNSTYNQMVSHMNELIEVVYEKEITQSRTELKALQAQINPHFLFNTLEAFYWSLEEADQSELAQTILAMSGLFRYVIGSGVGSEDRVTIRDELEHTQRYLHIMKMRLGDRLHWSVQADEELLRTPIPKLMIQPLVENAVLHGVESRIEPGNVAIRVLADGPGRATIAVSDDGPGMDEAALHKLLLGMKQGTVPAESGGTGAGVALSNVQRRLKLHYPELAGEGSGLAIVSKPGGGTTVSFQISCHAEEAECIEDDPDCGR